MKTLTEILLKTMKKATFALCFIALAINVNAQTNTTPANIVISNEKQVNASVEITIPEDAVFTENEETNQFYLSHPGFPKYVDTGNKEKDGENYSKAVNEWAKNNKAEFKKIIKEQASKQRAENDNSKVKKNNAQ